MTEVTDSLSARHNGLLVVIQALQQVASGDAHFESAIADAREQLYELLENDDGSMSMASAMALAMAKIGRASRKNLEQSL